MDFHDKKIAILGFGKEGQATLKYFLKNNVPVTAVLDMAESVKPEESEVLAANKIGFVGGPAYLDSLNDFDIIMRSPGVPRLHPKLVAFPNQPAIYSHLKLFFDLCPCPIIAVTGTKGKTTTATLIYEILKAAERDVFLGGNIGQPPLDFLSELTSDSIVVLEVSSFQAQDLHASPHVGVILNVTHDHLGDGTFKAASHTNNEEYLLAKAQLIANQTSDNIAILHPALGDIFLNSGNGKKLIIDIQSVAAWPKALLGDHNLENIAAAALAAEVVGVPHELIQEVVAHFTGVPQRLQKIAEKNGISYYNDSASTNPDSTIAAIRSFTDGLVLILGGSSKNLDYSELGEVICNSKNIKGVVLIGEAGIEIQSVINGFTGKILAGAQNMKEILEQANSLASSGDTILLSPAAASFGMFKNSKDRGNQFDQIVNTL